MKAYRAQLVLIVLGGLLLRLLFVTSNGYANDVSSFESWALTFVAHPFAQFYSHVSFADYPPGYFYILGAIGALYTPLHGIDPGYGLLKVLIKIPAIAADLGVGVLLATIARRFTSERGALGVAALYLWNPAIVLISAMWGQVDSVSSGLALLGAWLLLHSRGRGGRGLVLLTVGAWVALAFSLLIKPQAAVLIPLFAAAILLDPERRKERVLATVAGIAGALVFALLVVLPFHPTGNPLDAFAWLFDRYTIGKNVYPYSSVNAFNLWAVKGSMWVQDSQELGFWFLRFPMYVWGVVLVLGATILTLWRFVQVRTERAFLESAALLSLGFFMLATRMHERYVFDGVLFAIAAVPAARRYLWASVALSFTLFCNLLYALQYLNAAQAQTPGVDAANLWGLGNHLLALLNVGVFFVLGYLFLGDDAAAQSAVKPPPSDEPLIAAARPWFDPREGLARMRWPLDYLVAGAIGIVSFLLSFVNYWNPGKEIFDEVYFARAGEEYLRNQYIYESTHPPLTKLIITLSMMLFGGIKPGTLGDTAYGWRFLDVLFGALVVVLLYAFAKRLTRSTLFSAIAALMFTFDGMHFVQSRIATPEGIVVFFSVAAVYAFYRFWIASQVNVRAKLRDGETVAALCAALGAIVLGFAVSWFFVSALAHQSTAATVVCGVYFTLGFYLAARLWVLPRALATATQRVSYPDGSFADCTDGTIAIQTPDGGRLDSSSKTPVRGSHSTGKNGMLVYADDDLTIAYRRDATVTYETPAASAAFTPGRIEAGGYAQEGKHATLWLVVFTIALGALVASKWYGVMGFGVSFLVLSLVWLQRWWANGRAMLWGNPRGFRLDVALPAILFIAATVYGLVYVPDLARASSCRDCDIHSVSDAVYHQYAMFEYHDTLKATHPYASQWWEWPIDTNPVAYFYEDHRVNPRDGTQCCVNEITSLPNPAILWFGLFCVPFVGVLAWRERNKGYALLVITYLLQWLPWMRSPRITFAYHFYVNVPLIVLCNAIVLQRIWRWGTAADAPADRLWMARAAVGGYMLLVAGLFVYFYPVLAAVPMTGDAWSHRMWFTSWIKGPG